MRTYGGPWVPVEHFSIIDVPIPGTTAIRLDNFVYISKRTPVGIGFRPPVTYDMLPFIINIMTNPKTYEEAAAKYPATTYPAVDDILAGCL